MPRAWPAAEDYEEKIGQALQRAECYNSVNYITLPGCDYNAVEEDSKGDF